MYRLWIRVDGDHVPTDATGSRSSLREQFAPLFSEEVNGTGITGIITGIHEDVQGRPAQYIRIGGELVCLATPAAA
jgi:hypothetical protein